MSTLLQGRTHQRSQLRAQMKDFLIGAYGVSEPVPGSVDQSPLESQLVSLQPGFTPRPPQGTTMAKAFEQLLGQALAFQFPDHPEFDGEVRLSDLGKVLGELRRAMPAANGRIEVDGPLRPLMRQIAQPLGLGEMHERHFIFKETWPQHLSRELAKRGGPITVSALREAMDQPRPKGLPVAVQNLLILVFAEHGQYAFTFHGGPYDGVTLKDIHDDLVLIKESLADPEHWKRAVDNAAVLFGLTVNPLRTANNQNTLEKDVQDSVDTYLDACRSLDADLTKQLALLGLPSDGNRIRNARLAVGLMESLANKKGPDLVETLALVTPVTSLQALAKGITSASRVSNAIADNNWPLLEKVWGGGDTEGARIRRSVAEALSADELVTALAAALKQAQADATAIITRPSVAPPEPTPQPVTPGWDDKGKSRVIRQDQRRGLGRREAIRLLDEIQEQMEDGATLDISYTISREGAP